jgi:DNA primase
MLYDMDAAGQAATLRSLDLLLEEGMNVRIATLTAGKDPDAFIQQEGVEAFAACIAAARGLFDFKFSTLAATHDAATPDGRAAICGEMIPTLEKMKSEVAKDGYYKELADRLKVPEAVVLKERHKFVVKEKPFAPAVARPAARLVEEKLRPNEAALLGMMLAEPRWAASGRQVLAPEDFTTLSAREIVSALFELMDQGQEPSVAAVIARLAQEPARLLAAKLASDVSVFGPDLERAFNDCLKRVEVGRMKGRRETLREAIRAAEQEGDQDKVALLQQEFNQLIKAQ